MIKICHKSIKNGILKYFTNIYFFYCRFNKCIGCSFIEIGYMWKIKKRKVQIIGQNRGDSIDKHISSLNIACVNSD